ncbi:uncharacterized protein TRUGW13939_10788 [Talaromyces rugulosus]|uniref:Uncharacterized protein n=1 Tax=Talaromyces rugulosus TaxID=121627 RepID=A0A7H8RC28_TALRU|nr:uncharacterized protein TRUGW13939_10788 [Talaromyces rugulosus]QKX63617.1 hypothetical protein TRUGW13939_10788 [Talaromyces rugulosus]
MPIDDHLFGRVPDVLFLILSMGDAATIPALCRLNRATYETIKAHETLICTAFLRHHDISPPLDRILTMDPVSGQRAALDFLSLQKFMYRRETARKLASRVARSGWGAWWAIKGSGEMDAEAEMFRQRVERGLYVMFHMSDIARSVEETPVQPYSLAFSIYRVILCSCLFRLPFDRARANRSWWFPRHMSHIYVVLLRKPQQREVGKQRWRFRQKLDLERRIDFHIALQMLRQFLETIIFAHSPDDDRSISSLKEDLDVTNWFLLRQSAHSLSRIFLELPDAKCCSIEDRARKNNAKDHRDNPVCTYSEVLKEYWDARRGDSAVDCKQCETWLRSSSTETILNDFFGLHAYNLGKEWVRQMRGEGELLFEM